MIPRETSKRTCRKRADELFRGPNGDKHVDVIQSIVNFIIDKIVFTTGKTDWDGAGSNEMEPYPS